MDDPFTTHSAIPRQRSRANLNHPLPAPPSSRSLNIELERTPSPDPESARQGDNGHALRRHLQSLLEQKSGQLQVLGTMGQEILKQQQELEERIRDFEEGEELDSLDRDSKGRLKELDEAMRAWEAQNDEMMRELGGKVSRSSSTRRASLKCRYPRLP